MPRKGERMKIGQVYRHEGSLYQIMTIKDAMITAHSYGDDCGIDTVIYISRSTGKVIATKSRSRSIRK